MSTHRAAIATPVLVQALEAGAAAGTEAVSGSRELASGGSADGGAWTTDPSSHRCSLRPGGTPRNAARGAGNKRACDRGEEHERRAHAPHAMRRRDHCLGVARVLSGAAADGMGMGARVDVLPGRCCSASRRSPPSAGRRPPSILSVIAKFGDAYATCNRSVRRWL